MTTKLFSKPLSVIVLFFFLTFFSYAQTVPVISCPPDVSVNNEAGQCGAVVTFAAPTASNVSATAPSLYGASHQGSTSNSQFHQIDIGTGIATPIGTGIGFARVGGLDTHPVTGVIYATAERLGGSGVSVLITIDPLTGIGTEVTLLNGGNSHAFGNAYADISFRGSDNVLYAYLEAGDGLGTIDIVTGAVTVLGSTSVSCCGNGMTFDSNDNLYHFNNSSVNILNQSIGNATFITSISQSKINGADTDPNSGLIYGALNMGSGGTGPNFLTTIDPLTGIVTTLGQTANGMDGIAFGKEIVVSPTPIGVLSIIQTAGLPSGSAFPVGTTTNTFLVTDGSGNTDTCSFTVTVNDVVNPVIACPPNIVVTNDTGICGATNISLDTPTVTDNCSTTGNAIDFEGLENGITVPDFTPLILSTFQVTISAWINPRVANSVYPELDFLQDALQLNTWQHIALSFDAQTLKVYHNGVFIGSIKLNVPLLNLIDDLENIDVDVDIDPDVADAYEVLKQLVIANLPFTTVGSKLDEVQIWNVIRSQEEIQSDMNNEISAQPGLIALYHFNEGIAGGDNTGVTTAADDSGNGFDITLNDFALIGASSNWVEGKSFSGLTITNDAPFVSNPIVFDIGGEDQATITINGPNTAVFPAGDTIVTWTATDASGNVTTCTQTITVNDSEAPVITCPGDITQIADSGLCDAVVNYSVTATDNCMPTTDYIENGDFETGDFSNWTIMNTGSGNFAINDGTFIPSGTGVPLAPLSGNFDIVSDQTGPGLHIVSQLITVPSGITQANISWLDRIQNLAGTFSDPNQEFRVQLLDASMIPIYEIFSTNPGDPSIQIGPNTRNFDVTTLLQSLEGTQVYLSLEEQDNLGFFHLSLDNISFVINSSGQLNVNQTAGLPSGSAFPVGTTTNTFVVTDAAGNTDTCSFDVTVENVLAMWTGAIDTAWENAGNWDNAPGLSPTSLITIPTGVPNYPVLTAGENLNISECSSVTIDGGASLTVNPNAVVNNDGTVINNGMLTFESDTTGSAYIGEGSGTFIGDATIERYIPAKRAFRFLSSPVTTDDFIANNWQQDTHITGSTSGANGFDITNTGNPSMYSYDNVIQTWNAVPNTDATNLNSGDPYRLMVRGDRTIDLSDNFATPSPTTLVSTGELTAENNAPAPLVLNATEDGFSFIGNPFQAQVDMNNLLLASTNINQIFYWIWDPTLGIRGAYAVVVAPLGVATAGDQNQYLQAGQACFVQTVAAAPSSITFIQANKYTSGPETNVFKSSGKKSTSISKLNLKLYETSAFSANDTPADGLWIFFNDAGNNAVDASDASKFTNLDENFATNNNGALLSIETRAIPSSSDEIQLDINTYRNNRYTMVATGIGLTGETPFLFDAYTNIYTEIARNGSVEYSYNVDNDILATIAEDRFKIVYQAASLSVIEQELTQIQLYPNPSKTGNFYLNIPQGLNDLEVTIFNALGAKVFYSNGLTTGNRIPVSTAFSKSDGVYFVKLTSRGITTTKKLIIN